MKQPLTAERLREVLHYDPETGVFTWKVRTSKRVLSGSKAGTLNKVHGYLHISIDRVLHRSCRLAWLWSYGSWPSGDIDHVNGVRTDDRIANLRDVSRALNMQNIRVAKSNNQSGFLGVSRMRNRRGNKPWMTRIKVDGKVHHLGYFSSPEDAHATYLAAKRKLHEGCTI